MKATSEESYGKGT